MILSKIINSIVDKPAKKSTSKQDPAFKPSALGSPCLRKIYYSYNRVPEDYGMDLRIKRICDLGDSIHELLSEYLREAGVLIDYRLPDGTTPLNKYSGKPDAEFPLKDAFLKVSAKIDAVMVIEDQLWLGEWKSINAKGFKYLKKPKPEHKVQGALYLYLFRKALKEGAYSHISELSPFEEVQGVKFLYYNKENSELKEFSVTDASKEFTETIEKMKIIEDHIEAGTLPPGTKDWCQTCSWRAKCSKNYKIGDA